MKTIFPRIFSFYPHRCNKIVASLLSVVVIGINTYFIIQTVADKHVHWPGLTVIAIIGIFYLAFCVYLVLHMIVSMGNVTLLQYRFVNKYVVGSNDSNYVISQPTYSR